jgi:hypothetical protein
MSHSRLPDAVWRVIAIALPVRYGQGAGRTYAREDWARAKAQQYLDQGAREVRVYRSELDWRDVTSQ